MLTLEVSTKDKFGGSFQQVRTLPNMEFFLCAWPGATFGKPMGTKRIPTITWEQNPIEWIVTLQAALHLNVDIVEVERLEKNDCCQELDDWLVLWFEKE